MADLLPVENYAAVRAAIDVSLDSTALPDATIALDIYAGAAARDVLAVDPDAESRTGDDLLHAQAAAALFCAARLVGALPQVTRDEVPGNVVVRQAYDPERRAAALRALASAELDAYLADDPALADVPTMFSAATGTRGRWGLT